MLTSGLPVVTVDIELLLACLNCLFTKAISLFVIVGGKA